MAQVTTMTWHAWLSWQTWAPGLELGSSLAGQTIRLPPSTQTSTLAEFGSTVDENSHLGTVACVGTC